MKVLVLAAGYATRLYPLTKDYPKPLLKVKNQPIINYIVAKLNAIEEIDEILVVSNNKFMPHFKKWKNGIKSKKQITLVNDLTHSLSDRRGAIGDMSFAVEARNIQDDLLVIGGDNLFDSGLKDFLFFCKKLRNNPVIGAYDLKDKQAARKYGIIRMNKGKRIISFQEKPKVPKSTLAAMCLYYFPKEKLSLIGEYLRDGKKSHDATGFYIDWLSRKYAVYGFIFSGNWYDIGDSHFLSEAKRKFK